MNKIGLPSTVALPPRPRSVVAFVDATDPSQDTVSLTDLRKLERLTGDSATHVCATAWHHGQGNVRRVAVGTSKIIAGLIGAPVLAAMLTQVSMAAGCVAIVGVAGALTADALNLGRVSILGTALGEVSSGALALLGGLPSWRGRRTFDMAAGTTTVAAERSSAAAPSGDDVKEGLLKNFRAWPGAKHVVVFSGHGWTNAWSSVSHASLGRAFHEATRETGERPEVVLFDSCLQGTLTAMTALSGAADMAVASEDVVVVGRLPLAQTLDLAMRGDVSPAQTAARMVSVMARTGAATAVAVDLSKMPAVVSALDEVGRAMQKDIADGRGGAIREALHGAGAMPYEPQARGLRGSLATRDLKQFLDGLQAVSPDTQRAASAASCALESALVKRDGWGVALGNLGGLSFDAKPLETQPGQPLHDWTAAIRSL